jgi:hypothetical protein
VLHFDARASLPSAVLSKQITLRHFWVFVVAINLFTLSALFCLPSPFLRCTDWNRLCVLTFTHTSMLMPDSFTPAVMLMTDVCHPDAHRPAIRFDNENAALTISSRMTCFTEPDSPDCLT